MILICWMQRHRKSRACSIALRAPRKCKSNLRPGAPQLEIRLRPDDLALWGFEPVDVLDTIRTAYQGAEAGQVYGGNRVFSGVTILDPPQRQKNAPIGAPPPPHNSGPHIPLGPIAHIYPSPRRYVL